MNYQDDSRLRREQMQKWLEERRQRSKTPENSFFVKMKSSRPYNRECFENVQTVDPRSPYRE